MLDQLVLQFLLLHIALCSILHYLTYLLALYWHVKDFFIFVKFSGYIILKSLDSPLPSLR
jgi:hypothetical protein